MDMVQQTASSCDHTAAVLRTGAGVPAGRRTSRQHLLDCYLNASLRNDVAWLSLSPHIRSLASHGGRQFPIPSRWHATTQDRLFSHLRSLWPDDRRRIFVDLGCHAGHGPNRNMSDALLWLDLFGSAAGQNGSLVAALDVFDQGSHAVPTSHCALSTQMPLTAVCAAGL